MIIEVYTINKPEREDTGKQRENMSITPRRLGKYELQEPLGRGRTAEVWKAFDTQLRRYVAIKVLNADLREEPDFVDRFTHEARLVASLHVQCFVNSIAHMRPDRGPGEDSSQNIAWLGILHMFQGENWHGNHHARPAAAC